MAGADGTVMKGTRKKTERYETVSSGSAGMVNRSMPESLAAEAAVLGSMIVDPKCISQVVEQLKTEAFYRIEHQMIFDAILALFEKNPLEMVDGSGAGHALDAVLLRDELEKRKQLEAVGGVEYIGRVMESVPSSASVMYYAGIVKDKQLLREMIEAVSDILDDAYNELGEPNEKLDEAERRIFAVTDKKITGAAVPIKDLVTQAYELIEKREGSLVTGLPTGYFKLNEKTCGLQNGEMIIIAGRPSMGKTALALNIAEHMGAEEKIPVAIFSLEMGKQQLAERFMCSMSRIDSNLVRRGLLNTEQLEKLQETCGRLYEAPILIDDTSTLTPLALRAKARRLRSQHDIKCIIVDYMQLMHLGTSRVESRQQEISTISRYLKALARELNIPVVVLSQLNRSAEGRTDNKPRMSDLRESGSIEQDADVVMLLHRDDYYHRGDADYVENNKAELIIAKQRNGPTGNVELVFVEKYTRFESASYAEEDSAQYESIVHGEEPPF